MYGLKKGDVVKFSGNHSWSGELGLYICDEQMGISKISTPLFELVRNDAYGGRKVFATRKNQFSILR